MTEPKSSVAPEALLELMRRRRSFKPAMLKPEAPSREVITQLLEAANWAPSHGQTEPWRFTVFAGEARSQLGDLWAEAYKFDAEKKGNFAADQMEINRKKPQNAPVWISLGLQPALKPDGSRAFPEEEESQAVACAVQNLHLMATAHGMGGQWTTNKLFCHEVVARGIGLTAPGRLVGFFFVGHANVEWPAGKRGELAAKVRWA
jgi:nitroreductase